MGACSSKKSTAVHPIDVVPSSPAAAPPGTAAAPAPAPVAAPAAAPAAPVAPTAASRVTPNAQQTAGPVGAGIVPQAKAKAKPSSLIKAIKCNDLQVVEEMLQEPDCNLEMLGMWDNTPLLAACMYGHSEVALKLIERGADVFARNEHHATALHYSSVEGCLEVSKALLSKVEEGERSKLVNCGMAKVYNRHLDCYGERTPLAAAAESGFEDSTALLLAAGATFEADDEGRTPLWLAARHGRVEVVQVLLKHGADASQQDQSGVSVLNANTGGGRCHEDLISLLLSANVDVNQTSGSPLCDAVKGNKKQVVEALLTHGASTNMPNASGTTALHAACERGDESLVQLLVRFRADPGAADAQGSTPQELLRRRGLADAKILQLFSPPMGSGDGGTGSQP